MDFSYLDKKEYENIPLLDESRMNPYSENRQFFIRKYSPKHEDVMLHRHKYVQINYVYKGSGFHIVNNRKIEIGKGDIFVIPPYVPHVIENEPNKDLEIFEFEFSTGFILPESADSYVDFAYLEPFIVAEEKIKLRFNLNAALQQAVESILWEVQEEYHSQNPGYMLIAKALLLKLLVITGRAFSSEIKGTETETILKKYRSAVQYAIEYLESNYTESLSLEALAGFVNYSKSHFCYLFKAVTGKTYIEYLHQLRINQAKKLLRETEKTVTDISYEVGYHTIAHFNKHFKLITGLTPSQYRNTQR
jgi:AraC-like DNA-binding protein